MVKVALLLVGLAALVFTDAAGHGGHGGHGGGKHGAGGHRMMGHNHHMTMMCSVMNFMDCTKPEGADITACYKTHETEMEECIEGARPPAEIPGPIKKFKDCFEKLETCGPSKQCTDAMLACMNINPTKEQKEKQCKFLLARYKDNEAELCPMPKNTGMKHGGMKHMKRRCKRLLGGKGHGGKGHGGMNHASSRKGGMKPAGGHMRKMGGAPPPIKCAIKTYKYCTCKATSDEERNTCASKKIATVQNLMGWAKLQRCQAMAALCQYDSKDTCLAELKTCFGETNPEVPAPETAPQEKATMYGNMAEAKSCYDTHTNEDCTAETCTIDKYLKCVIESGWPSKGKMSSTVARHVHCFGKLKECEDSDAEKKQCVADYGACLGEHAQ